LETPQPGEEDSENKRDEILGGVELSDRQLLGLTGRAGGLGLRVGMVVCFHAYSQSTTGEVDFALQLLCIKVIRKVVR
jgi:hypothetical protein